MHDLGEYRLIGLAVLMAMVLGSICIYLLRLRRDTMVHARWRRARMAFLSQPFLDVAMQTAPSPPPIRPMFAGPAVPEGRGNGQDAWRGVQARLLALVEQDERGAASLEDVYRVLADYDALRGRAIRRDAG